MTPYLKYKLMAVLSSMLEFNPLYFETYATILSVFSANGKLSNSVVTQADILNEINLVAEATTGDLLTFTGEIHTQIDMAARGKLDGVIGFLATLYANTQITAEAKKGIALKFFAFCKSQNLIVINATATQKTAINTTATIQGAGSVNATLTLLALANLIYFSVEEAIQSNVQVNIESLSSRTFLAMFMLANQIQFNFTVNIGEVNPFNSTIQAKSSVIAEFVMRRLAMLSDYSTDTLLELLDESLENLKYI